MFWFSVCLIQFLIFFSYCKLNYDNYTPMKQKVFGLVVTTLVITTFLCKRGKTRTQTELRKLKNVETGSYTEEP